MKLKLAAVFDLKAKYFSPALCYRTSAEAMRTFEDILKDPNSMYSKHAHDFVLYELGVLDQMTGEIECYKNLVLLMSGTESVGPNLSVTEKN